MPTRARAHDVVRPSGRFGPAGRGDDLRLRGQLFDPRDLAGKRRAAGIWERERRKRPPGGSSTEEGELWGGRRVHGRGGRDRRRDGDSRSLTAGPGRSGGASSGDRALLVSM